MFSDDPQRQAMMMLAAGLLSPVNQKGWGGFGQALGRGIQGGLLGFNEAQQGASRRADADMRRKFQQAQLDEMERGRGAQDYMAQGVKQFMNTGTPNVPFNDALGDGSQGTIPGQAPSFDRQGFASYLAQNPLTAAKSLEFMPQPRQPKLGFAPNGQVVDLNDPNIVGKDFAAKEKPKYQKGDTRVIESGRNKITYEFDGAGWKKVASSAMDAPEKPAKPIWDAERGGFVTPQGFTPVPGLPADAKASKEAEASKARDAAAASSAQFVLDQVAKARDQAKKGWFTTGATGRVMRNVGGTDAFDLNNTVDSIKANIGFDTLAEMRRNSPTGGALGQVAVQELNMLQAARGALDTAQSEEQFIQALDGIDKHYRGWLNAVKQAQQGQQAAPAGNADPLGLRQ